MKRKFRAIALLLLVCMLFAGVTSCEFLRADLPESDTDEVTNEPQQEQGLKEVYLIRPQTVSNATKDLLVAARDYLKKETDFTVKLTSDYEEYEAKEGRFYILFGKTEYALSKELASKATDHEIRYKSTEDSVAIYAKNDQLFQIAVEKFFGDCFSEGTLVIGEEYREATIDGSDLLRENWTLGVPAYPYGKLDVKTYSAGYGLSLEKNCSYMQVANETDPEEFQNYLKRLER